MNPRKCNIIMKYEPQFEIETYETYESTTDKKLVRMPDNVTYTNRATKADRNKLILGMGMNKGRQIWNNI